MLQQYLLLMKLAAFGHLAFIEQYLCQTMAGDWIKGYMAFEWDVAEHDSLSYWLNRVYIYGLCDDEGVECWRAAIKFTPSVREHEGNASPCCGIWYCPKCLRSWTFPAWGRGRISLTGEVDYTLHQPSHMVERVPGLLDYYIVTYRLQRIPTLVEQLNWYAGLLPELYTKIWEAFPEAFPVELHRFFPVWLAKCQRQNEETLIMPVFIHPMTHAATYHTFPEAANFIFDDYYRESVLCGAMPYRHAWNRETKWLPVDFDWLPRKGYVGVYRDMHGSVKWDWPM